MRRQSEPLRLELLEDRRLLSTCHVNRLADSGGGFGFRGDLRYCINKVNDLPGPDIVDFKITGTINLTKALPDLTTDIDIQGPGADLLSVRRDTGGNYRVITVSTGASVQISGVTITNGAGGLRNEGTLSIHASTIADNIITNNTGIFGGGILNFGTLVIDNSTISGNQLISNSSEEVRLEGAGIYSVGSLTVDSSTISGNSAGQAGGGGGKFTRGAAATIRNSTVADNMVQGATSLNQGGGIFNHGALTLTNSTVARNTASAGNGGGIDTAMGSAYLHNTIVALNAAEKGPDLKGVVKSSGYNLFGQSDYVFGFATTDLLDVDPILGRLQDNGGPTQTMALRPGSPAIDVGDNADAPEFDQRGPGFPRIVNGTIDIGAFEVQATGAPATERASLSDAVLITAKSATIPRSLLGNTVHEALLRVRNDMPNLEEI